ncbi:hypothetical protein BJF78_15225 [Pseudonocardia sp. CNS-139]|nr:hypothetical protein BJF78_15225 [Pseudonocardia sp. CNS-139]
MFLTGRAVGRVLAAEPDGGDLAVTLGPVDITEVIRDGTFDGSSPVSFESPARYEAAAPFWGEYDVEEDGAGGPGPGSAPGPAEGGQPGAGPTEAPPQTPAETPVRPSSYTGDAPVVRPQQRPAPGFSVNPVCCAGGVGAHIAYDRDGVRLAGTITILMRRPSATFHLEIAGRHDPAGRDAGRGHGRAARRHRGSDADRPQHQQADPGARRLQRAGGGAARGAVLGHGQPADRRADGVQLEGREHQATGEWALAGALGFGYANGAFRASAPRTLTVVDSITDSIVGIATGVTGIIVNHQATFRVGLGTFGFTAGLYFALTTTLGLAVGSALGAPIEVCRSAQLGISPGTRRVHDAAGPGAGGQQVPAAREHPADRGQCRDRVDARLFSRYVVHPDVPICRA